MILLKKRKFKTILLNCSLILVLTGCGDSAYRHHYDTEEEITFDETTTEYYDSYSENITTEEITTTEDITTETYTVENNTEETTEIIDSTPENISIINSEPTTVDNTTTENITTETPTSEITTEDITTENNNVYTFSDEVEKLNCFYDEKTYDKAFSYGKDLFIKMVDFIFYGTVINGTTFDELSEENKNQIYENLKVTDRILMSIKADYKEELSDKYNIVKDFTVEKYHDALDLIKEKIGEEKYYDIKDKKDTLKEKAGEVKNKTLKNIKNWYEDFREN